MACATAGGTSFVWMVILLLLLSRVLMVILDRVGGLSAGGSAAFCRCCCCGGHDRTEAAAWAIPVAAESSVAAMLQGVPGQAPSGVVGRRVSAAGTTVRTAASSSSSSGRTSRGTSAGGPAPVSGLATLWASFPSTLAAAKHSATGRPGAVSCSRGHCRCPPRFPLQSFASTSAASSVVVSVGVGRFAGRGYTRNARRRGESLFQA
uniref:Putative secreted protein n=1 Tax=Ixodes ricinus TaxID=34613 RepID=A0A6B0V2Q1_IXORI